LHGGELLHFPALAEKASVPPAILSEFINTLL